MIPKLTLTLLATTTLIYASSTICFKKNHQDPSTIETIPMQGTQCQNIYSIQQMKQKGYTVEDIKITTNENTIDYIYILKKQTQTNQNQKPKTNEENDGNILQVLLEKRPPMPKEQMIQKGKELYTAKCQRCHGTNANTKAYNTSRALANLSFEEMESSIEAYKLDQKNNGYAIVMIPYANSITGNQLEQIHEYIQTLK